MQTEVNYDLLSRSDSMKRMTIKNMDNEFGIAAGEVDDKTKINRIQRKMQNKRSRKLDQQTSSCQSCEQTCALFWYIQLL